MKTYVSARGEGKTTLCLSTAMNAVNDGYEVYLVSPTAKMSDYVKHMAESIYNPTLAKKIHFIYADKVFKPDRVTGIDKRKPCKIIFDDLDLSLGNIVRERFGSKANIEIVTATEEWRKK